MRTTVMTTIAVRSTCRLLSPQVPGVDSQPVAEVGQLPGQLRVDGGYLAAPPATVVPAVGAGQAFAVAVVGGAAPRGAVTSHRPERAVISNV